VDVGSGGDLNGEGEAWMCCAKDEKAVEEEGEGE
tara:strand:+ start:367 stop:468 length:102 start_codon:yes stop_codon:yes gene_type:complete